MTAPFTRPAPELRGALAGTRVLIAYGLFGELIAAMRPLGIDYMGGQARWLRDQLAARVEVVRLPTGDLVAENAERIRTVILDDPGPPVLIAHSKGGLEVLAALRDPAVAARCRAFLAIQSPFYGSPLADALANAPVLRPLAGPMLRLGRTQHRGLLDLTTAARATWMEANHAFVAALVKELPVICCASSLSQDATGPDRRYLPLARWMERRGAGANDGLVPVRSALLPGARHLVVEGSHRAIVAHGRGRDPIGILHRMLSLALLEASSPNPPIRHPRESGDP